MENSEYGFIMSLAACILIRLIWELGLKPDCDSTDSDLVLMYTVVSKRSPKDKAYYQIRTVIHSMGWYQIIFCGCVCKICTEVAVEM